MARRNYTRGKGKRITTRIWTYHYPLKLGTHTTVAVEIAQHKRLSQVAAYLDCSIQRAVHDALEWWIAYQMERIKKGVKKYGSGFGEGEE
jgi:hypothetical protein